MRENSACNYKSRRGNRFFFILIFYIIFFYIENLKRLFKCYDLFLITYILLTYLTQKLIADLPSYRSEIKRLKIKIICTFVAYYTTQNKRLRFIQLNDSVIFPRKNMFSEETFMVRTRHI